MKKKFIAVSVLICALALGSTTLTSCVDDNESASVTAIRDAKAAQLNALANYQQAQADAKKIIAEAEAAIKNAEAKWQEIQNEIEGLELEKAKATLETDIEAAKAKAEAELLIQKAALEKAKAELLQASDAVDLATQWRINNLIAAADAIMNGGTYVLYTGDIFVNPDGTIASTGYQRSITIDPSVSINGTNGLTSQLLTKKADRVKAEYELTDIKLKIADLVREEEEKLARNEALLKEYQNYSNEDRDAAYEALNKEEAALAPLEKKWNETLAAYQTEATNIDKANRKVEATEVENYLVSNGDALQYITREYPERKEVTVTYEDGTSTITWGDYSLGGEAKGQIIVNTDKLNEDILSAERNVEIYKTGVTEAKKTETDGKKDDAAVYVSDPDYGTLLFDGTYKELNDAIKEASDEFKDDPTNGNKATLENLEKAKKLYEDGLAQGVKNAEEALETQEEALEKLNTTKTVLTGDAFKTYTTTYEAFIAAVDKSVDSWVAYLQANYSWAIQNSLVETLTSVAEGYTNWEDEINQLEQNINTNKKNIASMTVNENGTQVDEATKQAYIDALDVEIARLEKEISIKQAQYDSYMSQVEALINGEETPEVPETPEEGGEETPAE
jgi:chromosome segregation ATPase